MLPMSFEAEDANPEIQPEDANNQSTFFASVRVWKAKRKSGNGHNLPFGCIYDNPLSLLDQFIYTTSALFGGIMPASSYILSLARTCPNPLKAA